MATVELGSIELHRSYSDSPVPEPSLEPKRTEVAVSLDGKLRWSRWHEGQDGVGGIFEFGNMPLLELVAETLKVECDYLQEELRLMKRME